MKNKIELYENIPIVAGNFVKKRYMKCPYLERHCTWKLGSRMKPGYQYLENACYLSGIFPLDCPKT